MPKINVYLADDLAQAGTEAGAASSAVCQATLDQAVRRLATSGSSGVIERLTPANGAPASFRRQGTAFRLSAEQARAAGVPLVGSEHRRGLLAEGSNRALLVLHVMGIETSAVKAELDRAAAGRTGRPELDGGCGLLVTGVGPSPRRRR